MKISVFLAITLTILSNYLVFGDGRDKLWNEFKHRNLKKYSNSREEGFRKDIWKARKQLIESHNSRSNETYKLNENYFMDYVYKFDH